MPKSPPSSSSVNRLPSGNIELTITIPWTTVKRAYQKVVDEAVKNTEIKGFRKGHAPHKLIKARLDRNLTFSHALQHLLPQTYQETVNKHGLKPVVYPRIRIEKGKEGEDWVFMATLCEAPTANLVPQMLIELHTDARLATLAENLSRLGLTMDKYLAAKKLTPQDLRAKLASQVKGDIIQAQHEKYQSAQQP